jgi:hypothetical protein
MLLPKDPLRICFAHGAYRLAERFALRNTGIDHVEVRSADQLALQLPEADVQVVSMLWKLLGIAPRAWQNYFAQTAGSAPCMNLSFALTGLSRSASCVDA